jgi:hypothetical protein
MLTIEHCDNIHVHLLNGRTSILTEAIAAGLRKEAAGEQIAPTVQTSASVIAFDAAASGKAFNNTFHKVRAEVSRDWWDKIWKKALEWAAGVAQASGPATAQPPALGEIWAGQGGRYGGTMPARDGKPGYHLIVAETQAERVKFGPYDHDVTGAADHWDGLVNTAALTMEEKEHPAAGWVRAQSPDGHSDFYLPAHAELCQLWINVPQLFQKEGWYWSSTQYSPDDAWVQDFENGGSGVSSKGYEFRAVAVRRLAL